MRATAKHAKHAKGGIRLRLFVALLLCCAICFDAGAQQFMGNRRRAFAGFSPASLSGLKFWLNNDSLAGNNGDLVNLWTNAAAANGFTNGVSGAAPFLTNSVVNGRPAVAFDGANDNLCATGGHSALNNVGSASVFIVSKRNASGTGKALFDLSISASANARLILFAAPTTIQVGGRRLDADSYFGSDTAGYPSGFVLYAVQPVWSSSDAYCWTNGVQAIADTTWGTDGNTSATDSLAVSIGASRTSEYWSGWIAEFLVYVPALSEGERQLIEAYLRSKFNLW
jgi:hypothetical protein